MTKPIGDAPSSDTAPMLSDQQRARRRLGDWQLGADQSTAQLADDPDTDFVTAPFDTPAAEFDSFQSDMDSARTSRLGGNRNVPDSVQAANQQTSRMGLRRSPEENQVTAAFQQPASAFSMATAPMELATAQFASAASPGYLDTAPIADVTMSLRQAFVDQPTTDLPIAATTQFDNVTDGLRSRTVKLASAELRAVPATESSSTREIANQTATDLHAELSLETRSAIERLKKQIAIDPSDSDALFELSVVLHRSGLRDDARGVLTKLVGLYEERGQLQQAARIKNMLGAPKTGPISTETLPPRQPVQAATTGLKGRAAPIQGATVALRAPTASIGRAKELSKIKTQANVHAFPPESMIFTIPLPHEGMLSNEVRDILRQCDKELINKQYLAAFDSCLQVIAIAPEYIPVYLRLAELYTKQRLTRRARAQAEALTRLAGATDNPQDLWMVYRVLLHASGGDTASLKRLVELLIDAGQTEQASLYASRLIQILDAEGLNDEALEYSVRLCNLIPGDTRAALENAILRLKSGDRGGALDRWEAAAAAGADPFVARASVAALTTQINEDDHWHILSGVLPVVREKQDTAIVDAYVRTAAAMPDSPTLVAGHGLMLIAINDITGRDLLAQAAGSRNGAAFSRAVAAVSLGWSLAEDGQTDEYVSAVRTALKLLQNDQVATSPAWEGVAGRTPRFEDLSLQLGEALLDRGDAAGASEVLKEAHARTSNHGPLCERLAEAFFRTGQLGSALTVLDELAVHFRSSGQLENMAGVLRQMSQLAPNNIKVKSRLIDAYLQRGFVAEARAELIQRADLEERSGFIKDAVTSLQRAADLSWTIGLADETFILYTRVIAMAPDDVGNRSSVVNLYLQMGRLTEAAEHQRAVVDIALRNNRKHEAIAALHQVIGLTPDDTSAYYQLADLLGSMGEYHQAEKVYRRLIMMNPSDPIAQAKATSMASLRESHA